MNFNYKIFFYSYFGRLKKQIDGSVSSERGFNKKKIIKFAEYDIEEL